MNERSKNLLQVSIILVSVILIGTLGYTQIEGWSYFDSFYMTMITITTVGFSELHELSNTGRTFTVILIAMGYVTIAIAVAHILKFIVESEFKELLSRNKIKKIVGKMKNHYIICGYGNIGKAISTELKNNHIPFVIIEQEDDAVMAAEEEGYTVMKGNMTQDQVLIDAGIAHAAGVVACAPADTDNLLISLASRELNPMLFIIAKGEDPGVESRILRAGADIVVSPLKLGGQQVANLLIRQIGGNSLEHDSVSEVSIYGFSLTQFNISGDTPSTVKSILEEHDALKAVAIKRKNGAMEQKINDNILLHEGDVLIMLTYKKETQQDNDHPVKKSRHKRILIADDHRGLRSLFAKKLASEGNIIVEAKDGEDAIEKSKDGKYDLIILDVVMPLKSGFEVCREIREHDTNVPVILYSSDESYEFIRKGEEVGATACVRKTNKSHDLLVKVNELINKNPISTSIATEDAIADETKTQEFPEMINLSQLKDITGDDQETMQEVLQMFFDDSKSKMKDLSNAVLSLDFKAIKDIGHYFKGGASNMGIVSIEAISSSLEKAANAQDESSVALYTESLVKEIELLDKAYLQFKKTGKPF